ncbi:unnamed protein product, partial [Ectocarpus fasciculatus]
MAGAPQGQIFDVVALKSSEVPASVDVSKDLEAVQAPLGVGDWASLFAAVSSARTLLLHHGDVLGGEDGGPGLMGRLVSLVADAVSNRRSVVQTNGLRCLGELFSCAVGKGLTTDQMGTLVRSTWWCHKSSSKFCGEEAKKVMEAALANADPVPLLTAVLPQALDRHPKVASRGVMYTAECLSRLHEGSVAGGGLVDGVDVKSVVAALAKGASSRDSDGKEAAWRGGATLEPHVGSGVACGAGVYGFGGGIWTVAATADMGEPLTKDTASATSWEAAGRGGERSRPLQLRKGSSGERLQQQHEGEGHVKVSSVGAGGEEGARCWEDAVAAITAAKRTPDQCPEMHVESDDEGSPATRGAVTPGEPITDSKVLMTVKMPEATALAAADASFGGGAEKEHGASGGVEKASGETPVVEATMAPGGLVLEVDGAQLDAIDGVSSEERQMAGAPQGQIFDVVALKSSEVPASVDVSKDLE